MRSSWMKGAAVMALVAVTVGSATAEATRKDGRPKDTQGRPDRGDGGIDPADVTIADDLILQTTNTPMLRLDQTAGGGFTAQMWDVAGNEANFFVRDVTSGSRLPLRIRPGAPTSAIDIAASGDVGLGTALPLQPLHIAHTDPVLVRLERTGAVDPNAWDIGDKGNGTFKIDKQGNSKVELQVTGQGMFRVRPVKQPPTTDVALGSMYTDTSKALCWYTGDRWIKVVGPGSCR